MSPNEGDLPACHQHSVQKPTSLMVWGAYHQSMGSLHVLEGAMNAEKYIKVLEQHMLPSRWRVIHQDNAKPHIAAITTAWLCSRRVRVLNWPAYSPDLSPIENIWYIIKQKIRQRRPRTLQQLETYIRQEFGPNSNTMIDWLHFLCSALFIVVHPKRFTIMWGVSSQPPPVCSIHLAAMAATGQRRQCAHHTPATGEEERES